ncbi:hypothetical protein FY858_23110 [Escherichia coli]|nr:hypothetical protein [Escherichia coli]EGE2589906.1 hypothetical protein [Escherichia coli]
MNIWLRFFYSFVSNSSLITICSNLENLVIGLWICPYISRHLLSLNPSLAHCRRYSRGER